MLISGRLRAISLCSLLAALYVVLLFLFQSLSFLPIQVRVADMLIPTSIIYGWPATIGVTLGVVFGNFLSPFGLTDIILGAFANLFAASIGQIFGKGSDNPKRFFFIALLQNLVITIMIGSYLWLISAPLPEALYEIGLHPLLLNLLAIFFGSFVAINVLGVVLVAELSKLDKKKVKLI